MSAVVVLGAGVVGAAATWDLIRRGHDVVVADISSTSARRVADRHGAAPMTLDASDRDAVRQNLESADAFVSAVSYDLGDRLLGDAIATGTHYVDFGGNPATVQRQLTHTEAAAAAGVVAVPDCGLAPGLANVLAEDLIDRMPGPIDSVQIRVGALPQTPKGALGYQLAFSPAGLINEYAEACDVLAGGAHRTVEPLGSFEDVTWDGLGPLEAFSTAGGTSTMCSTHLGRVQQLEYKTLRYPGHGAAFRSMLEIGLFEEHPSETGSAPRDVLLRLLADNLPRGEPDVVLVRTWADQDDQRIGWQLTDRGDPNFSALARTTAFPATALVDLILRNEAGDAGVRAMHAAVAAHQLMPELAPLGLMADPWP